MRLKCDKCKRKPHCDSYSRSFDECERLGFCYYEPETNYDRIIIKTPEEMAEWLADTDACPADVATPYCLRQDCNQCWLDWLKKEANNA